MTTTGDVNLLAPSITFDYRDYYFNPQGQTVYFPNASPAIVPPQTPPVSVDFSAIVKDKYDPVDSPYFLPTQEDQDRIVARLKALRKSVGSYANIEFFHGGAAASGRRRNRWPSSNWLAWLIIGITMFLYFRAHV